MEIDGVCLAWIGPLGWVVDTMTLIKDLWLGLAGKLDCNASLVGDSGGGYSVC